MSMLAHLKSLSKFSKTQYFIPKLGDVTGFEVSNKIYEYDFV